MAKKQAPVVVTITKTKHEKQPFTAQIDKPGRAEPYDLDQRYADRDTVRRGALRNLKAQRSPVTGEWFTTERSGKVTWIEFRYIDHTRKGEVVKVNAGVWGIVTGRINFTKLDGGLLSYNITVTHGKHKGHNGNWLADDVSTTKASTKKTPRKVTVTNDLLDTALHVHRSTKKK